MHTERYACRHTCTQRQRHETVIHTYIEKHMHVNGGTFTEEEIVRTLDTANTCSHTHAYTEIHMHTVMQRETDAFRDRERTYICRNIHT
jgi:hypothetical protein